MSSSGKLPLEIVIATTLALIDQFSKSLISNDTQSLSQSSAESPSPLVLLKAVATSLKSQTTKLSLLAITNPFTPSAIVSSLQAVNDSILPSLVTAALLTTSDLFTTSFSSECASLTRATLRDFQIFIRLVETRNKTKKAQLESTTEEKNAVTEVTGRVWQDCDDLVRIADEGVPGLVLRKTKQWLELMKDAVKELQEWDPDEEVDEDDLLGVDFNHQPDITNSSNGAEDNHRATISEGVKDQALKVLNRIPQSIHVVIKQRIEKELPELTRDTTSDDRTKLDLLQRRTRAISELIDESAEAMYMGNPEQCLRKAGEARALTIDVVEAVVIPFKARADADQTKEDAYVKRALEWIRQVDPGR